MIFLDFEASALANGYPIEIGWAIVNADRRVTTEAHFIHCDRWLDELDRWDPDAEQVHHITRRILMEFGKAPLEVATRANDALSGHVVHIDSRLDEIWATQLYSEAGIGRRFIFDDARNAFRGQEVDQQALAYARRVAAEHFPRTHRAAEDAAYWAHIYRMSLGSGHPP